MRLEWLLFAGVTILGKPPCAVAACVRSTGITRCLEVLGVNLERPPLSPLGTTESLLSPGVEFV